MLRLRKLLLHALCSWMVLSGGLAFSLAALEAAHDREHLAWETKAHDAGDHRHAQSTIELFSELFAQPGFDQLTCGSISLSLPAPAPAACSSAPLAASVGILAFAPPPPPGPPPRFAALHRGGGITL